MSRARYSYTDFEGHTHGLLTLEELREMAEAGKIPPESTIVDLPQVISRRADSIPGLFSDVPLTKSPTEGASTPTMDKMMGNIAIFAGLSQAALAIYPYLLTVISPTNETSSQSLLRQGFSNPISYGFGMLWYAPIVWGGLQMMKSKRIGFVISLLTLILIMRSAVHSSSSDNVHALIVGVSWVGLMVSTFYSAARLAGCLGPIPEP